MNVKDQEVTKTQKVYELTEKEFNQMKIDLYNQGRDNAMRHILFALKRVDIN